MIAGSRDCLAALADLKSRRAVWTGSSVKLAPLEVADVIPAYPEGLNHPEVARFVEAAKRERQTLESVRAFVRANAEDPRSVLFGILFDSRLRGTLRLHDVNEAGEGWVGIALFDRTVWGRGIASAALRLVAERACKDLGLQVLRAGIDPANAGSRRAFAKAGFHLHELLNLPEGRQTERWARNLADCDDTARSP